MNTGKYKILELLEFTNLDQFIIPEIQRDYVWGKTEVVELLDSLKDSYDNGGGDLPYLGFIYAYQDKDYVYKYFLVDGQQRMTTVFILLLSCYQLRKSKVPDYIIKNGKLKIDYKVRQITHDFLFDLVSYIKVNFEKSELKIEDQVWYHKGYENDITIINISQNYYTIKDWLINILGENQIDSFLKFVENTAEISYFNIDEGRQGEELYIYMNSRGRNLEANETLKAKYLNKLTDENEKTTWGAKWENWQDFFWKHKGSNSDADENFNEFLRRVQIINMCELQQTSDKIIDFAISNVSKNIRIDLLPDTLTELEKYFEAYKWLVETDFIITFFNQYESENYLLETPSMGRLIYYFRILPIMTFVSRVDKINQNLCLRFIRFFYNISRKTNVSKDISNQLPIAIRLVSEYCKNNKGNYDITDLIEYQKGRTVIINDEEVLKLELYKRYIDVSQRQYLEQIFWKVEDHPVFNGEITFLLEEFYTVENKQFDLSNFEKTWKLFEKLFDNSNDQLITIALLYYGNTWERVSPLYYDNYNCQNWNWLVRQHEGKYLMTLLKDLLKMENGIDEIIKIKIKDYFTKNNIDSIEKIKDIFGLFDQMKVLVALDYYSNRIIWRKYACIADDLNYTYEDIPFFKRDKRIFNIKRYIRNGSQGRIIALMNEILQSDLKLNEILALIF